MSVVRTPERAECGGSWRESVVEEEEKGEEEGVCDIVKFLRARSCTVAHPGAHASARSFTFLHTGFFEGSARCGRERRHVRGGGGGKLCYCFAEGMAVVGPLR